MKILVLGDVHGNLIALEKVINKYNKEVDQIVSHGDVVNYGPWSNECVQLLDQIKCICLKGNHEEAYINGFYPGENLLAKQFFDQTFPTFKYFNLLNNYDELLKIGSFEIKHSINNKYYYPDTDTSDLNLEANTIIGHSHHQFHKVLGNGKTLTNTGSVGQNRKCLSIINFTILDLKNNTIELKNISYDPKFLIQQMKNENYPEKCIEYYKSKLK